MREKHRDRDRRLPAGGSFAFRAHVALVGPMGAGKTTVGRLMSEQLALAFLDTDERIEVLAGMSVGLIFERSGEAAFRAMERDLLEALPAEPPSVIAAGGGLTAQPGNPERLRAVARTVFLDASPVELLARLGEAARRERPMVKGSSDPEARLQELLEARRESYQRAADARIFTDGMAPMEIAARAIELLKEVP